MGWTRKQFRDDLDAEFSDSANSLWTPAQKNNAINQGVSALWPECKNTRVDETVTLAANIFIYTPTGQPPELGYSQACLEQGSDEPYKDLRRWPIRQENVSGTLKWKVYLPKNTVDNNVGKKLRLHYHCQFDHYSDDVTTQDVPYLPVFKYACMKLCILMLQKSASSDIGVWRDQIPEYRALWLQAKKDNLVLSMARYIGLRRG